MNFTKEVDGEEKEFSQRCARVKFDVEGSPELLKLGYEAGFGQGNARGFGCVEVVE